MDAKTIMEQILKSGQDLAEKGKDLAAEKMGVPEDGAEKDAMMSGLGKGAAATGIVALLLGTRLGRRITGKALKYGTLAALGTVAYKAYQNYQESSDGQVSDVGKAVGELDGPDVEKRSMTLLKAMISAAKADGHVDEEERKAIQSQLEHLELSQDAMHLIHAELEKGLDVAALADEVDSPSAAAEVYLASRMILDVKNMKERAYLDNLAQALDLSEDLVDKLEAEV